MSYFDDLDFHHSVKTCHIVMILTLSGDFVFCPIHLSLRLSKSRWFAYFCLDWCSFPCSQQTSSFLLLLVCVVIHSYLNSGSSIQIDVWFYLDSFFPFFCIFLSVIILSKAVLHCHTSLTVYVACTQENWAALPGPFTLKKNQATLEGLFSAKTYPCTCLKSYSIARCQKYA